jgi:hypothetical protein
MVSGGQIVELYEIMNESVKFEEDSILEVYFIYWQMQTLKESVT